MYPRVVVHKVKSLCLLALYLMVIRYLEFNFTSHALNARRDAIIIIPLQKEVGR